MKSFIRRLARRRYALYALLAQGALSALIGLWFRAQHLHQMQDNPLMTPQTLIGLGAAAGVLAIAGVIASYVINPVEIVKIKQPPLPDVQMHTHRTPDLSQVS
jgi:hypothetical protein